MQDFKVTEHFTYFELTKTVDHPELLIANREHFIAQPFFGRLQAASEYMLEEIRDEVQAPVVVLSGGRFPGLNAAVNGSLTSQHKFERPGDGAFDFLVPGMSIPDLAHRILDTGLLFYQMRIYGLRRFIHLGMPRERDNMQVTWVK